MLKSIYSVPDLTKHTGGARNCFAQTYAYVQDKFMHPEYAFVVESGDRKLSDYSKKGVGNYHHPRHLMINLLAFERMIKRGGRCGY